MTKVMNVAMIGGGFMGKAHAMAYASMPMFFWPAPAIPHRKVVVDITDGAAEEARRRFGFDEASSDWRSVVARPDIDVVDICTPNNVHAEIAIAAAKAGKHIICEKPLARTVEEARAMTEAAKAAGIIHMVAFNYRRTPAVALAKKYIDEGRIGRIRRTHRGIVQVQRGRPAFAHARAFQRAVLGRAAALAGHGGAGTVGQGRIQPPLRAAVTAAGSATTSTRTATSFTPAASNSMTSSRLGRWRTSYWPFGKAAGWPPPMASA